jgi:hypothetical protein
MEKKDSKDFLLIVLKSGQEHRLSDFNDVDYYPQSVVECILLAEYSHTYKGPVNVTDWYKYRIVNRDLTCATYKIDNFEIILFDTDNGCTNFFGRQVTIHDCRNSNYYSYKSLCESNFITDELKPLLLELNDLSTDEAIRGRLSSNLTPFQSLQKENEDLRSNIDKYKALLENIKNLIDAEIAD